MKKKYILYPLFVIVLLLLICGFAYIVSDFRMGMIDVYVANVNIPQKELIKEEYLRKTRLPKLYINENVVIDKKEIVGKYTALDYSIPKGSMFYKNALNSLEQMNDAAHMSLKEGQVTYDLSLRKINANPANINKDIYCDLYLTINRKMIFSDILISNAKITGLYDNDNKEIRNNDTRNLATISIAIDKEMVSYLNKAITIGEINLIISSDPYKEKETSINLSEDILSYLS